LGRQVQDILATDPHEDGFVVSRSVHFRGRRLYYGDFQRDASVRLFRKTSARLENHDGHVRVALPSEQVGALRAKIHYEACFTVEQYVLDLLAAAGRAAKEANEVGARPKRLNALWKAPWRFVRSYFLRRGWMDGWAGLQASGMAAFAVFLRESLLWNLQRPALGGHFAVCEARPPLKVFDPGEAGLSEQANSSQPIGEFSEERSQAANRAAA
jgi:hypothetical protein